MDTRSVQHSFINSLKKAGIYQSIPYENVLDKQRFALFRIFSMTGTVVCIAVFLKMYLTIENSGILPWLILTLGSIIAGNYLLVSRYEKLRPAYLRLIISSYVLLHIVSYDCGGIQTSGTFYFAVVILYAYMLLGTKTGNVFVFIAISHVIYLFFISAHTHLTSFSMFKNDTGLISQDFLVNAILIFFLTASQCNYLQSGRNIVISRLEESKKELEEKNKLLEEKNKLLKDYAEGLEKTNRELEKFASVTSHDLKAPLRAIGSLTDIIEEENGSTFSEGTNRNFSTIKSRVRRMEELINSLLEYSKIKNQKRKPEPVELTELIAGLKTSLPKNNDINIDVPSDIPLITTDKAGLRTILFHLIKNAVLFNDKDAVKVKIAIQDSGKEWTFTIKDNGPGIDKIYHEKIFTLFQTLNRRDEIETTGAGLAISKKIVETSGGRMWVKSEPGNGAEFVFTLPKKEPVVA